MTPDWKITDSKTRSCSSSVAPALDDPTAHSLFSSGLLIRPAQEDAGTLRACRTARIGAVYTSNQVRTVYP